MGSFGIPIYYYEDDIMPITIDPKRDPLFACSICKKIHYGITAARKCEESHRT